MSGAGGLRAAASCGVAARTAGLRGLAASAMDRRPAEGRRPRETSDPREISCRRGVGWGAGARRRGGGWGRRRGEVAATDSPTSLGDSFPAL